MKINIKNKKVIAILGGIAGIAVIGSYMLYSSINEADNYSVSVSSAIINLKQNINKEKSLLLESVGNMKKISPDKESSMQIDSVLKEVNGIEDRDETKTNESIKVLDKFNEELDKMIEIYENDDEMKKDISLANKMEEIGSLNILIDSIMSEFNLIDAPSFNEAINKFPVNIVAKTKGWGTVNNFISIK